MGPQQLAAFSSFFGAVAAAPLVPVTNNYLDRCREARILCQELHPDGTMAVVPELVGTRQPSTNVLVKLGGADIHHFNVSGKHIAGCDDDEPEIGCSDDDDDNVASSGAARKKRKGSRQRGGGRGRPCDTFEGADEVCATFHGFAKALDAAPLPPVRTRDTFPFRARARAGGLEPSNPAHALIAEIGLATGLSNGVSVMA